MDMDEPAPAQGAEEPSGGARAREVRAVNVYPVTKADQHLLLAGGDLEAVLADRERETRARRTHEGAD
jgi:hypothetical protein